MNFENLIAVRVSYYVDYIDETIALVTSEDEARKAAKCWFFKHVEDEGGWATDYNIKRSKKYDVYFDEIEADGTIDRGDFRKDAEFTIYDLLV
jgi:hypothetical protein